MSDVSTGSGDDTKTNFANQRGGCDGAQPSMIIPIPNGGRCPVSAVFTTGHYHALAVVSHLPTHVGSATVRCSHTP